MLAVIIPRRILPYAYAQKQNREREALARKKMIKEEKEAAGVESRARRVEKVLLHASLCMALWLHADR